MPSKRDKKNTGKPYEALVENVIASLIRLEGQGFKNIKVERDIDLDSITKDSDGKPIPRQIDVYWEFEFGGLKYKTVIQAKDHAQKINMGMIDTFRSVLLDLPGQPRGIMITTNGLQSGALKLANAYGIGIYELRSASSSDFPNGIVPALEIFVDAFHKEILKARLHATKDLEQNAREFQSYCSGDPSSIYILDQHGDPRGTAEQLMQEIEPPVGAGEGTHAIIQTFSNPSFVRLPNGTLVELSEVRATVKVSRIAPTRRLFTTATHIFQLASGEKTYIVDDGNEVREPNTPLSVETSFDVTLNGKKGKLKFKASASTQSATDVGGTTDRETGQ